MRPDAAALIWDAHNAARLISEFVAGRTWPAYRGDALLRSAVERQFQIIGEALGRLARLDSETGDRIPELPRIVAFRNVLVHGYAVIDDELVWEVASQRVAPLGAGLGALLAEYNDVHDEKGEGS